MKIEIKELMLSDFSSVYDVHLSDDFDDTVILSCGGIDSAKAVLVALEEHVVGFETGRRSQCDVKAKDDTEGPSH